MEPGVPFALLGAVQLLVIASGLGLAGAAVLRRNAAGFVLALGGAALSGVGVATALRLGDSTSDGLAVARGVAGLLIAVGLWTGGLGKRKDTPGLYGVVVPLAAAAGPSAFSGIGLALAAVASFAARRDNVGRLLGAGLLLDAAAGFVAQAADSGSSAPTTVLVLRGLGSVLVLVGLALLAQASLLSKVVVSILVGVLAMAVAAVGVVGNVVVSSYEDQARQGVQDAAAARSIAFTDYTSTVVNETAKRLQVFCDQKPTNCAQFAAYVPTIPLVPSRAHDFLLRVYKSGKVETVQQQRLGAKLKQSALLTLRSLPTVNAALTGGNTDAIGTVLRLQAGKTVVALAGVVPQQDPSDPSAKPTFVYVYGIALDQRFATDQNDTGGFGLYVLAGEPLSVVASNKSAKAGATLLDIAARAHVGSGIPATGVTVGSQGLNPTVAFRPLADATHSPAAYFAITRDPTQALAAERDALRLLVITSLAALLLVAVLAIVVGRRTVEPVRRLTVAAERIAAGDLTVATGVRTRDEVGTLAARFDAMTSSLGQLTGDLRDSAARLSTVLASMSDGLLATDADGVVTSVNRAALEMLGLEQIDVLGEPLGVVADVRDLNDTQLASTHLRLRDEAAEVLRPDGSRVPVRVAITPLQGAEGVVMVLRDTTREREVERMKTEFLSNVSHELRTPLTPIRGYAEILVSRELGAEQVKTFSTTIRDEALKMNRVVDLLVDVAALEAGRVSVTPRDITPKQLLDVRIDAWQSRARDRAKDFKRRVATGLPALHVDPTWVGKALDELIDNAVKYTPQGTPITLGATLSPDGTRVRITVKDAGPGIPEAAQATLFTSFEQVDGSATRKVGGLGLGLSFVRRVAEDSGFPLSVASKEGKGAEFSLDLPVSDAPITRRGSRARPR
ncbi:MAG: Two-component sensor histidine kinase [Frankiales bacterium]|nr:Two-component sensor histidine kinase [Frankiales bacterium]